MCTCFHDNGACHEPARQHAANGAAHETWLNPFVILLGCSRMQAAYGHWLKRKTVMPEGDHHALFSMTSETVCQPLQLAALLTRPHSCREPVLSKSMLFALPVLTCSDCAEALCACQCTKRFSSHTCLSILSVFLANSFAGNTDELGAAVGL